MLNKLDEFTDWKVELSEQSAGIFRLTLHDLTGCLRYSATGNDPEILVEDARRWLNKSI